MSRLGAFELARADRMFQVLNDADGLEGARHDLGRAGAVGFIAELVLEQFRVGKDDPELIVQPVKQAHDVGSQGVGVPRRVVRRHG